MTVLSDEQKQMFKQLAISYFQIDDSIKSVETTLKTNKKTRKEISNKILEFMKSNAIDDLSTDKGKLQYNVSNTKVSLNKKVLQSKLLAYFGDNNDKAVDVFKYLDNRERQEKVTLKVKLNN